ncbi:hypothetical protein H2201_008414 [Coniosporium apollinis]|uniref:Uncharacterized protein n=2 Tax=Coniosporium TaxID=2810619 RepID=A0ABQ9NGP2_9PEZI|nr:hypothetical protein H2199_003342 [Cladosporium sp. JES 115]KAJ9656852.1 hypothetical protein H2201_008414 [Coniosporium apollinis]
MGFWSSIADAFSRDGVVTTFCEKIPVVGHVTAGIQALAGNPDHAWRALATSTGALGTLGGIVAGFVVGNIPGAIAGGALGSQVGLGAEWGISKAIDNQEVKGDVGEVTLGRCVGDAVLGGTSSLLGSSTGVSAAGKEAGKLALGLTDKLLLSLTGKQLGQAFTTLAGKEAGSIASTSAFTALGHGISSEWCKALRDKFPVNALGHVVGNLGIALLGIQEGEDWIPINAGYQTAVGTYYAQRDMSQAVIQQLSASKNSVVQQMILDEGLSGVGANLQMSLQLLDELITRLSNTMATDVEYE